MVPQNTYPDSFIPGVLKRTPLTEKVQIYLPYRADVTSALEVSKINIWEREVSL